MNTQDNINSQIEALDIISQVKALEGVQGANCWTRVPGKERIYVDTIKLNGGKNWNGGVGYAQCFIDLTTKTVIMRGEAGAATRKWHAEHGTKEALEAIAQKILS